MTTETPMGRQVWTSYVVAQIARAAVGLIGPGIKALGCAVATDSVVLHFVEAGERGCDREDLSDIAFELDVLLDGKVLIETVVHGAEETLDWAQLSPVYVAKE